MSDAVLRTFGAVPSLHERERMLESPGWESPSVVPVRRRDGATISLRALDRLMGEWRQRRAAGEWGGMPDSDRWLAPRLHWALRISRSEAADKGVWLWLSLRYQDYLEQRWGPDVTEDRWTGGVNKQALARLWWGAEVFRDGDDYAPVVAAFTLQDLPNSFLQREVTRIRPFAVALARYAVSGANGERLSADRLNNIAGVANLVLAGLSPEAHLSWWSETPASLRPWLTSSPDDVDWEQMPVGPDVPRIPVDVAAAAAELVRECDRLGADFARSKGNRAGKRMSDPARLLERMYG